MEKKNLIRIINKKRNVMLETAETKGMNDKETVKRSQELDELIMEYQRCSIKE